MAYTSNILQIVLDGTGTEIPALNVTDAYDRYIISGAVTATGNYAIVPTGTPQLGTTYIFEYEATLDITTNGTTFSLFGVSFNQTQLISKLEITCYYNGSAWKVKIVGSLDQAFITSTNLSNNAVTASAITNSSITLAKLAATTPSSVIYGNSTGVIGALVLGANELAIGNSGGTDLTVIDINDLPIGQAFEIYGEVSWDSGEQNIHRFWLPTSVNAELEQINFMSFTAIAGTDDAYIQVKRNSTEIYASTVLYSAGATANSQTTITFSPHEAFTGGNTFNLIPSKTTPGGKAKFSAIFTRT